MSNSKYARRFKHRSGTVKLMEDLAAADSQSLMLGGGNPAHIPQVQAIFRECLQDITADSRQFAAMLGDYSGPEGDAVFIEALANYLSDFFGHSLSADNIVLTNGSQASFGVLFNCFAGEQIDGSFKRILLPMVPEYIGYSDQHLGSQPIIESRAATIEQLSDDFFKYRVDRDALCLSEQHAAICLSRPTNPTGNVVSLDELNFLADAAESRSIPLIVDVAYGLPFPGVQYEETESYWRDNLIVCMSLSKLGLPGARTGIVLANADTIAMLRRANAINSLAPGNIGPHLMSRLLTQNKLQSLCKDLVQPFYQAKMEFALTCVRTHLSQFNVRVHKPEGAFFLWLWFDGLPVDSRLLYERLRAKNVFVLAGEYFFPGYSENASDHGVVEGESLMAFDRHRSECIRISYAQPDEAVDAGIAAIAAELEAIYLEAKH